MSHHDDNLYTILDRLAALQPKPEIKTSKEAAKKIYESVEARGSILSGVDTVQAKLAKQFAMERDESKLKKGHCSDCDCSPCRCKKCNECGVLESKCRCKPDMTEGHCPQCDCSPCECNSMEESQQGVAEGKTIASGLNDWQKKALKHDTYEKYVSHCNRYDYPHMDKRAWQRYKNAFDNMGTQGMAEGAVKDILYMELSQVARDKDYGKLSDLMSDSGTVGRYLQQQIEEITSENGLHPDDDFEEIETQLMARLQRDFGDDDEMAEGWKQTLRKFDPTIKARIRDKSQDQTNQGLDTIQHLADLDLTSDDMVSRAMKPNTYFKNAERYAKLANKGMAEGGSPSPYMSDQQAKKVMGLCRKGYTPDQIADRYPNLNKDEIDDIWGSMDDSELEQGMEEGGKTPKQYWNRDSQSIGSTPDDGLTYADPDEDGVHYPDYGNTKFQPQAKPKPTQAKPTQANKRLTDKQYAKQLHKHYASLYDTLRITFNRRKNIFSVTGNNGFETDYHKYRVDPATNELKIMMSTSVENESVNQGVAEGETVVKGNVSTHKGTYGNEYQGDPDDDDGKPTPKAPKVSNSKTGKRGRPTGTGKNQQTTGRKYDHSALSSILGGSAPKNQVKGKVHTMDESVDQVARRLTEGVNLLELLKEKHQTVDEMLAELSTDIANFKESGHCSELLKDCMDIKGAHKKDKPFTALDIAPAHAITPAATRLPHQFNAPQMEMDRELNELARLAGLSEDCGDMPPIGIAMQDMQSEQDNLSISTTYNSRDGKKTISVNADGKQAEDLLQMLRIAGLGSGEKAQELQARPEIEFDNIDGEVSTVPQDDLEELSTEQSPMILGGPGDAEMDEAEFDTPATEPVNGPKPEYQTMKQSTMGPGEGDPGEKAMHPDRATNNNGDNALSTPATPPTRAQKTLIAVSTLESKLAAEYESIKKSK